MLKDSFISWESVNCFKEYFDAESSSFKYDYVVGVLNGGAIPASIIAGSLGVPLYWVQVSSYKDREPGEVLFNNLTVPNLPVGSKVLIVDDIFDTGRTFSVVSSFLSRKFEVTLKGYVFVSKDMKCVEKGVSYFEFVQKDKWVVFPWEFSSLLFNKKGV